MKLSVLKNDLVEALKVVGLTVGSSAKVATQATISGGDAIRSHFVFRHRNGSVEVLSNSEKVFSSAILKCEVEDLSEDSDENCFTLEAKRLRSWLRAVTEDKVFFQLKKGKVIARTKRGRITFPSLDPSEFPFWDSNLEKTVISGKMKTSRLKGILSVSRAFASDNETQVPELCSCEFRKGFLFSSDTASASVIRVGGMEDSSARIFGKEIGAICKFLDLDKEGEVEILETSNYQFFRLANGSVFGQTQLEKPFPHLDHLQSAYEDAHHWWKFSREEMISAISFLVPSARVDNPEICFSLVENDILVELVSAAGDKVSLKVPCKEARFEDSGLPLESPFPLSYEYFLKFLGLTEEEEVQIGIHRNVDDDGEDIGGYVAMKRKDDQDEYLTVLGWYQGG